MKIIHLSESESEHVCHVLRAAYHYYPVCCIRIEFEIWLEAARDVDVDDDGHGFQFFCAVCASATAAARLGNFQSECAHRQNQSLLATRHLGSAKDWTTMAAESFLQSVGAAHEELMMMRRPDSFDPIFHAFLLQFIHI